jgi:hypothetical protein
MRWIADALLRRRGADEQQQEDAGNRGVLVASGLIAGEALTGVLLAIWVIATGSETAIFEIVAEDSIFATVMMVLVFLLVAYMVISPPLRHFAGKRREG